jgi:hypothetical protein
VLTGKAARAEATVIEVEPYADEATSSRRPADSSSI